MNSKIIQSLVRLAMLATIVCVTGCVNGYSKFYHANFDPETMPQEAKKDIQFLAPGEKPKVFSTNDMDRDVKIARSKVFIPIGWSSFNGPLTIHNDPIAQATSLGAVMVLTKSSYTGTQTNTIPLFLPNNQTTYTSGVVGGTNFYGSSTSYGTTVVPMTTQTQRYEQGAVFFAKSLKKPRYGVSLVDLTPEIRSRLERNTGALILVVSEDSPAFTANVLPDDILLEINGTPINNANHALKIMTTNKTDKATFKIIRNDKEKLIDLVIVPIP